MLVTFPATIGSATLTCSADFRPGRPATKVYPPEYPEFQLLSAATPEGLDLYSWLGEQIGDRAADALEDKLYEVWKRQVEGDA